MQYVRGSMLVPIRRILAELLSNFSENYYDNLLQLLKMVDNIPSSSEYIIVKKTILSRYISISLILLNACFLSTFTVYVRRKGYNLKIVHSREFIILWIISSIDPIWAPVSENKTIQIQSHIR